MKGVLLLTLALAGCTRPGTEPVVDMRGVSTTCDRGNLLYFSEVYGGYAIAVVPDGCDETGQPRAGGGG